MGGSEESGGVQDLPERRNAAEDEGSCRGTRRTEERSEVMWLRRSGGGRRRVGGGERRTDDVRGSEVLRLRHGGRLGEAGEDAQHGSILSQETLVHPPQALDLSQSRESLHRGGEREIQRRGEDREERESVQGGRPCAERKDSQRG